jgi:hypothetical protein
MAQLITKIKIYANQEINFLKDVILQDDSDGKGPYIKQWNLSIPQPTQAQLDALDAQGNIVEANQVAALAQEQANKQSALNKLTALGLTQDEINALLG